MAISYYPKSPLSISENLTSETASYKFRVSLALLSILLFFILYTAMVVGLAYLAYYAIMYDMGDINKLTILLKLGAIAGSVMLFVFTLKFIFKLKNHKPNNRIKLEKNENPELWNFVYQICKETHAPTPKSIYVDPEVNAYVSYTNTWLSLFLPVKKELTIGLGLVSCLNLSEFKAVMSHEFGHFAQRSMKIGSYIMTANTIIHDMIFSRDRWDELLAQWRASDIRLSAAAWVITPIIWVIRQILNLFYQFLNIMYSSLSIEMEFNADKVAVSTSGSDAIISGLWKLDNGSENWNKTMNHAYIASQKKIFVNNLYLHNLLAMERGNDKQRELLNNLPEDSRGGKKFFSTSKNSKTSMYASHPPNDKREDNAKAPYIACDEDARSPWILFSSKENLQKKMTSLLYKQYFDKKPTEFVSSEEFENFISAETISDNLFEEYDNTFENRFLHISDIKDLEKEVENVQQSQEDMEKLKANLLLLMKPVKEIELKMINAQQISEGTTLEKSFSFKGNTYTKRNIQEGYEILIKERETLYNDSFKEWDISFCNLHFALANKANRKSELTDLYNQHKIITKIYKALVNVKNTIYQELNVIQTKEDVSQSEVNIFGKRVNNLTLSLNKEIEDLEKINFVRMPNIDNVIELKEAITEDGSFTKESGPIFENGGFDKIINRIENAVVHCQRIEQKSIGVILLFHKELQNQFYDNTIPKK